MSSITINETRVRSVEIRWQDQPLGENTEIGRWDEFRKNFLLGAFRNRRVCLISGDNLRYWSRIPSAKNVHYIRAWSSKFVVCFIDALTEQLARDIVDSMEFDVGWLTLAFVDSFEEQAMTQLVLEVADNKQNQPFTQESLITGIADGHWLIWMNPPLGDNELNELIEEARSIAGIELA